MASHTSKPVSFDGDFAQIIDGKKVSSQTSQPVLNPATKEPVASAPIASRDQLDAAVAAAARAFPAWAATPWAERAAALHKIADLCTQYAKELSVLLTKESGKTLLLTGMEAGGTAAWFHAAASQTLPEEVMETPDVIFTQKHAPLGVGAAIIPWNFPLWLMSWKVAPGLLAGNTIIIKPSPLTPLATIKFVELAQQVLPPGVLSVLSGNDDLGPWITSHPGIAKVAFTGSTATGQSVMRSALQSMKRVTLELGGNDAAIVLPDVDVKKVAPQIFWAMFQATGQICAASKRTYVHADVYDALRDELVSIARTMKIGNGLDAGVTIGPLQNEMQFKKVQDLVQDCKKTGLTVLEAGEVDAKSKGYFLPLSIVDNPPDNARIVREEQFGPIAPLMKWTDEDDVVRRANDSEYGLGAVVWGKDLVRANKLGARLQAGTVWINNAQNLHPLIGFGGHKLSGVGVEGGKPGLLSWTNVSVTVVAKESVPKVSGEERVAA